MNIKDLFSLKNRKLFFGLVAMASLFAAMDAIAEAYSYDALGRLTSVTNDSGVKTYYCYDKAGNRTAIQTTPCP